jgi:hypothetical protein
MVPVAATKNTKDIEHVQQLISAYASDSPDGMYCIVIPRAERDEDRIFLHHGSGSPGTQLVLPDTIFSGELHVKDLLPSFSANTFTPEAVEHTLSEAIGAVMLVMKGTLVVTIRTGKLSQLC